MPLVLHNFSANLSTNTGNARSSGPPCPHPITLCQSAPCSVNAWGRYFRCFPRPGFEVAIRDLKNPTSAGLSSNMKSLGKRSMFQPTCSFSRLGAAPQRDTKSLSSRTFRLQMRWIVSPIRSARRGIASSGAPSAEADGAASSKCLWVAEGEALDQSRGREFFRASRFSTVRKATRMTSVMTVTPMARSNWCIATLIPMEAAARMTAEVVRPSMCSPAR